MKELIIDMNKKPTEVIRGGKNLFEKEFKSLSERLDELDIEDFLGDYCFRARAFKNELIKNVKEFIKRREFRLRNQIRIHWSWLKNSSKEEVADFMVAIANAGAGDKLR